MTSKHTVPDLESGGQGEEKDVLEGRRSCSNSKDFTSHIWISAATRDHQRASGGISRHGEIYIRAFHWVTLRVSWVTNISIDGGRRYVGEEHSLWKTRKIKLLPNRRTSSRSCHKKGQPSVLTHVVLGLCLNFKGPQFDFTCKRLVQR